MRRHRKAGLRLWPSGDHRPAQGQVDAAAPHDRPAVARQVGAMPQQERTPVAVVGARGHAVRQFAVQPDHGQVRQRSRPGVAVRRQRVGLSRAASGRSPSPFTGRGRVPTEIPPPPGTGTAFAPL